MKTPTVKKVATAILIVLATMLLPSCSSKSVDPFDLALNQTIARMAGDIGKEDAR